VKKVLLGLLVCVVLVLSIGGGIFYYKTSLLNFYFRCIPLVHWGYAKEKALVQPYFDKAFYEREYAAELEESGIDPLDHFMQRSCRWGGGDYDPNPWFNTTVYRTHLWPCSGNAFVDFLHQPPLRVPANAKTVEIYANADQFYRAWMAVEGFMRMQKFKVLLILPASYKDNIPLCFHPQIERGLEVQFSKDHPLSFYHSPFLKDPDGYEVTELPVNKICTTPDLKKNFHSCIPTTRFRTNPDYHYLIHGLRKWLKKGRLNPCMLNFAHCASEPLPHMAFGPDAYELTKSIRRLAPAFDLMFVGINTGTSNARTVPGCLEGWIDLREIPAEKKYEVSFLLTLGGRPWHSPRESHGAIYYFRKLVWNNQKKLPLPINFYVSYVDAQKYPPSIRSRALPTDSKKWIFGSQFTIAIENTKQKNYFTEKLLGPFLSLCVPIYIGCPNITDYFDPRGMFIAEDPDEIVEITKKITPKTYAKMLPYLKENKRRAEKFLKLEEHYIEQFYKDNVCAPPAKNL